MTTLVTFVGKPQHNNEYNLVSYRFDDGYSFQSRLFALAIIDWRGRSHRPLSRVLFLGTPTSGWDMLLYLVEQFSPHLKDDATAWALRVLEAHKHGAVEQSLLREFENLFGPYFGFKIELALVENEGESVFGALHEVLENSECVVLDITHSFRSMPAHALIALGALRWIKGVELHDILCASMETQSSTQVIAHSLESTAHLARHTPALAQLSLVNDIGHIAEFFAAKHPSLANKLCHSQQLESLVQFDQARVACGQALGELRKIHKSAMEAAVGSSVETTLVSLNQGEGSLGLRKRAESALNRSDYFRALVLIMEALKLKAVEKYELDLEVIDFEGTETYYMQLNNKTQARLRERARERQCPTMNQDGGDRALTTLTRARNSISHPGGSINRQKAPHELLTESSLRSLLEWGLRFYDFV